MATTEHETLTGPWLSYEEAAKYTCLSESTIRQLVAEEAIPHRLVGVRVLIPRPALDAWLTNQPTRSRAKAS